jgi:hypothetical protein
MGIGMHRIVHHDELIVSEIPSTGMASQSGEQAKFTSFASALYFTVRVEKSFRFYLLMLVDGKSTLLSARIGSSEGKESLVWSEEYLELNGCF